MRLSSTWPAPTRPQEHPQKHQTRLVVVGACYLDTILSVPHYPGEDEKLRAASLVRRRGGNGPNTLEVIQQLIERHKETVSLSLCSVLPAQTSAAVKEIRKSLGHLVDLSCCIYRPEHTEAASSYILRSLETGSRTIVNYNDLPEMQLDEFTSMADKLGNDFAWFHFEGRIPDTTLECIRHLRHSHPSAKISVEVEKPGRARLQDLAAEADVVFYSKTWAQHQGYRNARECLEKQPKLATKSVLLCCTWGEDGASIFDRRSGKFIHVPAFLPEGKEAIDSTGAGDTFIAGVLYCLLLHSDIDSQVMVRFATKLAGCKVAQEGFKDLGNVSFSDSER